MECNKDEATRARDIAERKLAAHDYSGALKFLQKAQQLFPGLDNLAQMFAVVNVHIAAQKKINGTEVDWYGILQVDPRADDIFVKKQYRRLALLLHPDKNKFPGAESAFKLVGEASQILSDKQQRSVHDSKRAKPVARTNKTAQSRQHPQGTRQYSQASSQHVSSSFVTACPSCQGRFRIMRIYESVAMACPQCHAPFQARDILSNGVYTHTWPPQFPQPQPGFSHNPFQSFPPNFFAAAAETFFKANKTDGSSADQIRRDQEAPDKAGAEQKSKRRRGNEAHDEKDSKQEQKKKAKADLKAQETLEKTLKKQKERAEKKKRRSKMYHSDSSSDDDDSSNSLDDLASDEQQVDKTDNELGCRRSSRPRRNVRYKMDESDDDEDDLQESDMTSSEDHDRSGKVGGDFDKDDIAETGVSSASCKDDKDVEEKGKWQTKTGKGCSDGETVPAEHGTGDQPEKQADEADEKIDDNNANFSVPDADFYDFDKDREEKDVETGQVWAGYDDKDGMPRYYFRVKDVLSHSPFEVNISWLELRNLSKHQAELKDLGFSLTCGSNFRSSRVQTLDSVNMFSHIVKWEKGPKGAILIYPRTGDVWALYKDWEPSLDCMKAAKPAEYDMVEVLTDFNEQTGVRVARLDKLNGYKTIFKCTEAASDIPALELTRFSHQVPARMLTGEEAPQAPAGCWQLDPASVPIDLIFPNSGIS